MTALAQYGRRSSTTDAGGEAPQKVAVTMYYILVSTMSLKRAPRQLVEFRPRRCPVHHALAIDEILRMITFQIWGPWEERSHLLALATTCKTWSVVALDELWTEITSKQLVRIFSMRNECIASNRPDIYTEFLRKTQILMNIASQQEIADVWSALPTFRPHTIICLDSSQPIQTSVLAPYITTLSFDHDRSIWDAAWLENLSSDLQKVSSSLKVLEIALVPRISSMKGLRHLGSLRALRKLKLLLTDDFSYEWIPAPDSGGSWLISDGKGLHALEELDIEAPIPIVHTILGITGSKLRNLRITGTPFDSPAAISSLFAQISEGLWATAITHLRYGVSNSWLLADDNDDGQGWWGMPHLERETMHMTSQHLRPLLQLNSLSHLALTFHARPRLDDMFYSSLVHKLPLLQNLHISGRDRRDDTSLATLRSVLILAQLPLLSALHISFDMRVDAGDNVAVEQHFNSLTRLCVCDSPVPTEHGGIISTIAAVFPKLRKVYIPDATREDSRYEGWLPVWKAWKSRQTALGIPDAKFLKIKEVIAFDPLNQELDEDFFAAAASDSLGYDETEYDSVDYVNSSVDLDEYYTRFPEARRHPFEIDDIIYATPQDIST